MKVVGLGECVGERGEKGRMDSAGNTAELG